VEREVVGWLVRFGTPLLFFAQVFGIFGLPIPDELLLTVAGALVASGRLRLPATALAAVAGCLTGITLSYALGRWVGLPVLHARFASHRDVLEHAQNWFRRFGGWLLMFGYFIPGVRHVTAIAAGSGGLEYRRFAVFAYPGGIIWCSVFLAIGYFAGDRWPQVVAAVRMHTVRIAVIAGSALVLYAILRVAAQRRRT
jgi:membrane protein DedA with SNARE-associated domain